MVLRIKGESDHYGNALELREMLEYDIRTEKEYEYPFNDIFAENAWYFRNSLVRANYNNYTKGIRETSEYLELIYPMKGKGKGKYLFKRK
jgi:hypothetical protein